MGHCAGEEKFEKELVFEVEDCVVNVVVVNVAGTGDEPAEEDEECDVEKEWDAVMEDTDDEGEFVLTEDVLSCL